jgi:hypothetical protein
MLMEKTLDNFRKELPGIWQSHPLGPTMAFRRLEDTTGGPLESTKLGLGFDRLQEHFEAKYS